MNKRQKNKKKGVRRLECDRDFLTAFLEDDTPNDSMSQGKDKEKMNRHGLPFVEDYENRFAQADHGHGDEEEAAAPDNEPEEDFAQLLAESLKAQAQAPGRRAVKPVPLKKRLKRYPSPEADLDLHGFTAIGAEARAKSFLQTALRQGVFTVRIIVGRGIHSPEGPVLPQVVEDLVKALKAQKQVLSYEWDGGRKKKSGSLVIYLNQFND